MTTESETAEATFVSTESIQAENLSIGGNINQHYYGNDRTRLIPVEFGSADERFVPPNYFDSLFLQTCEKRIVFISGDEVIGKSDLARHLSQELKRRGHFSNMEIVELLRENENQEERRSVIDLFHKENQENKIVLLYDLHPERIDYNFDRLLQQVDDRNCVFIITVESSLEVWQKAGRMIDAYWFEIPAGRHYSEIQLCDFLLGELRKKPPLFLDNSIEEIGSDFLLSPSYSVIEVASKFMSVERVHLFLTHYRGLTEMPGDHKLNELMDMFSKGHIQMIRSWFYQLNHYEKILALSAALFDGVLVDQYLESIHNITETSFWNTSDPLLKAVDYFNLNFLDAFFRFEMRNGEQYLIRRSPSAKQVLLDLGRTEYRRHFKTAFNTFYKITEKSYSPQKINWELYGTSAKRSWIRRSFIETLRVTGEIEYELVENHLLELAASGHQYLQAIGAKSMAQWRLSGHESLLFSTLKTWQKDEEINERIEELFNRNPEDSNAQKVKAVDLIQTTAVMTLGYAAYYDRPNQLHEEIVHAMVGFAKSTSQAVVKSMHKALPKFIHHHSVQLKHILFEELMPVFALREPIVKGLLLAMQEYPDEVSGTLETWLDDCLTEASSLNRRNATTFRDNQLIVVLNVFEQMEDENFEPLVNEKLYEKYLIPLLHNEGRTEVMNQVIRLLAKVQASDYLLAARFANDTHGKLKRSQQLYLVRNWGNIYLEQRLKLSESELGSHEENYYPVWIGTQSRPLTNIEQTLYAWMEANDLQRRFATLVFLHISLVYDRLEQKEMVHREVERQRRELAEQNQTVVSVTSPGIISSHVPLHLFLRIRIFVYFLFSSNQNKYLLKDTILLFLNVNRYSSADLEMLIRRWNSQQKGITQKMAKWLHKFL